MNEERLNVFTIEELKKLCAKNYPDNCKECPMYKNDCEHYEKGHKWQDMDRVLPKDWQC